MLHRQNQGGVGTVRVPHDMGGMCAECFEEACQIVSFHQCGVVVGGEASRIWEVITPAGLAYAVALREPFELRLEAAVVIHRTVDEDDRYARSLLDVVQFH